MTSRRNFLKTTALAAAGVALLPSCKGIYNGRGHGGPLTMKFFPYELQLRHTFTVASYSRKVTPDVQVEISYDGVTGYGEASMPPYLGQSVESVCSFLSRVDLSQFADPFCLEDILSYVDSLSPEDSAAKAAVDIALHDLVG
jgi:L-alanine-DL-glutamate epimerase-like enolase superfamily enzyme